MLLGKSYENDLRPALSNFICALQYANNNAERLLSIATELEKLGYTQTFFYNHGLIQTVDPNYDHEIPQNFKDYDNIVEEYIQEGKTKFAKAPIEKLIELSENKVETLLKIGKLFLQAKQLEEGLKYFNLAIEKEEYDAYSNLSKFQINISEFSVENEYYELCIKTCGIYEQQNPDQAYTLQLKAQSFFQAKGYDEALPLLEQIVKQENFESADAEKMIQDQ